MGEINEETKRSNEGRPCATHSFANPSFHSVPILYSEACSTVWCNPASLRSSSHERPFIKSIGLAVPSAAPMPNHSATTTRLCNYPCLALRQNREKTTPHNLYSISALERSIAPGVATPGKDLRCCVLIPHASLPCHCTFYFRPLGAVHFRRSPLIRRLHLVVACLFTADRANQVGAALREDNSLRHPISNDNNCVIAP